LGAAIVLLSCFLLAHYAHADLRAKWARAPTIEAPTRFAARLFTESSPRVGLLENLASGIFELLGNRPPTPRLIRRPGPNSEEANRENRRIIAALMQRIPELPPASSQEAPGARETAAGAPGG